MKEQDIEALRSLLRMSFRLCSHEELTRRFRRLGIGDVEEGTEDERIDAVLGKVATEDLVRVAKQVLAESMADGAARFGIEDWFWAGQGPQVTERTRRELAAELPIRDIVGTDHSRFMRMLSHWWDLDAADGLAAWDGSLVLRWKIHQHVLHTSGRWSTTRLFDELGAFDAGDRRFAEFLEDLVAPTVLLDEDKQRRVVEVLNRHLSTAGIRFHETGTEAGYPLFRISTSAQPPRRPKSLIFATSRKPDLRMSDVIDNDIDIVDPAGALVYNRPIGGDGLRWNDLQQWWSDRHPTLDTGTAKKQLYTKLRKSLPDNSPPQQLLFDQYHHIHGDRIPELPALLPEVWLHWDHKTVSQRGAAALLGHRMDFMMLLPGNQRIVLEVDGRGHYTDDDGNPSPKVYARNTASDRTLRLRGYEVFRFGGAELQDETSAAALLTEFFKALFMRFDLA